MSNPGDRPISPSLMLEVMPSLSNLLQRAGDNWQIFWGETRTRILAWYILILAFTVGASVPVFRYLLFTNIDARVRRELVEELENFRNLLAGNIDFEDREPNDQETDDQIIHSDNTSALQSTRVISHVAHNRGDLSFKSPKTVNQLKQFFDVYMAHRIPEDEVYFIAFVDGQFYNSSPRGRPKDLHQNSVLLRRWAQQTQSEVSEEPSEDPEVGSILYIVEPIRFQNQLLGVFVIAHSTAGERAEGIAATLIAFQVAVSVVVLALCLVWLAAGRVLQPLQALTKTVESIGESDLTRRIPAQGKGELAKLATQFNAMMERLETAFITQREFINDAGHELRTPITIIRGHLEVMDVNSEEQQATLALVIDELDRISRFVDDLILLAKAERPDFLQLEAVDAATLIQELFMKAQALARRDWCLEEVAQGQITVDRQRLTQAIMNLVQNAIQHTKKTDTITLGSAIRKSRVHFWVRDTGTGIALTDQQRIFERFARVPNQRRRSEGAGLGLSIVKAIVTAHGGEVTVRSQLGAGATFAIVLPVLPPNQL